MNILDLFKKFFEPGAKHSIRTVSHAGLSGYHLNYQNILKAKIKNKRRRKI